jgi:hypothetical protein
MLLAGKRAKQKKSQRQKTPIVNLVRSAASGVYYYRVRGKLIWKQVTPQFDEVHQEHSPFCVELFRGLRLLPCR